MYSYGRRPSQKASAVLVGTAAGTKTRTTFKQNGTPTDRSRENPKSAVLVRRESCSDTTRFRLDRAELLISTTSGQHAQQSNDDNDI